MLVVVIFVCTLLVGCNAYYSIQSEDKNMDPNEKIKRINNVNK